MARWRLMASHYINVQGGTKWEYTEIDRTNGRPKRVQFDVPRYLDINDPGDWTEKTDRDDGIIVVTNGGYSESKDIRFNGDPTPDMYPLDDEAKKISASFEDQWRRGADAMVSGKSYAETVIDSIHDQMKDLQAAPKQAAQGFEEAMKMMAMVMQQNQQILAQLVNPDNGPIGPGRIVQTGQRRL